MDGAPPSETAPHEILPELLLAELDDLAAALRLDLAVAAELQDGRLDVRSASGPLAGHLPSGRSVALAECPAERAAVEGARVELAPGGVDPLLGFVFPLTLPPLRERLEDLPMICEVLLAQQSARTGRSHVAVTPAGLEKLASHTWPGNLRELGNVLERATILSRSAALGPDVLDLPHGPSLSASPPPLPRAAEPPSAAPPPAAPPPASPPSEPPDATAPGTPPVEPPAAAAPAAQAGDAATLDDLQRAHIERVLRQTKGRVYGEGGAARILGLKPSTLQGRMRKLGLRRPTDGGDV